MGLNYAPGKSPEDVAKKLKDIARRANNPAPVLAKAAPIIRAIMDESFNIKESPDGRRWAPNKPSTLAAKRGSLGIETGRLKASMYARAQGNKLEFGSSGVPYAAYFNWGTRHMPGRSFLPSGSGGRSKIVFKQIKQWMIVWIEEGKLP